MSTSLYRLILIKILLRHSKKNLSVSRCILYKHFPALIPKTPIWEIIKHAMQLVTSLGLTKGKENQVVCSIQHGALHFAGLCSFLNKGRPRSCCTQQACGNPNFVPHPTNYFLSFNIKFSIPLCTQFPWIHCSIPDLFVFLLFLVQWL